jgi:hypothetical protein
MDPGSAAGEDIIPDDSGANRVDPGSAAGEDIIPDDSGANRVDPGSAAGEDIIPDYSGLNRMDLGSAAGEDMLPRRKALPAKAETGGHNTQAFGPLCNQFVSLYEENRYLRHSIAGRIQPKRIHLVYVG